MMIQKYINNPNDYVDEFTYRKRGKKRTIVKYKNTKKGKDLREYHNEILNTLNSVNPNKNSYAYRIGCCTKDALTNHMNSNLFIKLDIHSFFESIMYDNFIKISNDLVKDIGDDDLRSCFYGGHLCLGQVTSPKLSDIYLKEFDEKIEKYLETHTQLNYSRYCDDILISTTEDNFGQLHTLEGYIIESLKFYDLTINEKKRREFNLNKDTSVSFLGLNIVVNGNERIITISKSFILKTLKMMDKVIEILKNDEFDNYYYAYNKVLAINSRVAYIKNNSEYSYNRFLKKYKNKYNKDWNKQWQQ